MSEQIESNSETTSAARPTVDLERPSLPGRRLRSKLASHAAMVRRGDLVGPLQDYRRWLWSTDEASGYRVDLATLGPRPEPKFDIRCRPMTDAQAAAVFAAEGLSNADVRELKTRERVWKLGLPTAYAATTPDGDIAFVGFCFNGRTHRDDVLELFGHAFCPLAPDEVLIENIWTHPSYRNGGVAAAAIHDMLRDAAEDGQAAGMIYIDDDNPASWLSMRKIGFQRCWARRHQWRFARVTPSWTAVADELPRPERRG